MAKRPYHHGNLRAALLDAVVEQVREGGVRSVTLRETARRAGVSHAAPAYQVGSKRGLMTAFATQGQERLGLAIAAGLEASGDDPRERLEAVVVSYARFATANPEHFAVMFSLDVIDEEDAALRSAGQPNFDTLLQAVTDLRATGWRADQEPLEVAIVVWAAVHGLAQLWLGGLVDESLMERGIEPLARKLVDPVSA